MVCCPVRVAGVKRRYYRLYSLPHSRKISRVRCRQRHVIFDNAAWHFSGFVIKLTRSYEECFERSITGQQRAQYAIVSFRCGAVDTTCVCLKLARLFFFLFFFFKFGLSKLLLQYLLSVSPNCCTLFADIAHLECMSSPVPPTPEKAALDALCFLSVKALSLQCAASAAPAAQARAHEAEEALVEARKRIGTLEAERSQLRAASLAFGEALADAERAALARAAAAEARAAALAIENARLRQALADVLEAVR